MNLHRVTITGADGSVKPTDLVAISADFPFVEWGVLFSKTYGGKQPTYPSEEWVAELCWFGRKRGMNLAAHLGGSWVKDLVEKGIFAFPTQLPREWPAFQRVQLNYKQYRQKVQMDALVPALLKYADKEYLFQASQDADAERVRQARTAGVKAFLLFDHSGGRGVTPADWPAPDPEGCGYAGGLGPDNLEAELERLASAVGPTRIWIDMQSKVRTTSGSTDTFDLAKVRQCLELARARVTTA